MSKIRRLTAGLCLTLAVGMPAQAGGEVQQAIAEAKAAYDKADSIQGAWVNTSKLIEKAQEAAAKGDEAKAMELAAAAKKEAQAAYAQAAHEKEHWAPPPYVR